MTALQLVASTWKRRCRFLMATHGSYFLHHGGCMRETLIFSLFSLFLFFFLVISPNAHFVKRSWAIPYPHYNNLSLLFNHIATCCWHKRLPSLTPPLLPPSSTSNCCRQSSTSNCCRHWLYHWHLRLPLLLLLPLLLPPIASLFLFSNYFCSIPTLFLFFFFFFSISTITIF